jgi:hypothetical protein
VEYLQNFIFVLKHKVGKENKVVDALSMKALLMMIVDNGDKDSWI